MGRAHNGFDVYLGAPDTPQEEHALAHTATVIYEDLQHKVVRVKARDENKRWNVVYTLTETSTMQRNGTAIRWTGTSESGEIVVLSGISNRGGCVPCSRR